MITLHLTSNHSYSIVSTSIEANWVSQLVKDQAFSRVYLFVDEQVWTFHQSKIERFLVHNQIHLLGLSLIKSGESSKSIQEWSRLTDELLNSGVRRNDAVFVFGGGVTGDLGGFTAATALRGIPLVHFPTTLLAMVDSSIGGKTGINHTSGKNRIGAFYQPIAVICDSAFLNTLPEEEWFCGIGEIIKYGCISDPSLFDDLKNILESNNWKEHQLWSKVILQSAQIKADIVQEDEKENGVRAHLNFGHTFAHALERVLGYGEISHGDAVFWGCIAACKLSYNIGYDIFPKVEEFLGYYKSRFTSSPSINELMEAMYFDKKNKSDQITFVLIEKLGKAFTSAIHRKDLIQDAWVYMLNLTK